MANFTDEQIKTILESKDWETFVKKWNSQGIDKEPMLEDYLGNIANASMWEERFKQSSVKNKTNKPQDGSEVQTVTGEEPAVEIINTPEGNGVENKTGISKTPEGNGVENKTGISKSDQSAKRVRSANSDTNDAILDQIRLTAMRDLGHISDDIYSKGMNNPKEAIAIINSKMPLKESQMAEFEAKFIDIAISQDFINILPPSMLAKAYDSLKKQAKDNKNEKAKSQLDAVTKRIDELIVQAANREGLYFADVTNIPDTYDGYMDMMKAREVDLDENSPTKRSIAVARNYLGKEIAEYDDLMNLNKENLDATELYERYEQIEKGMKKVELKPEDLKMLSAVKFLNDKNEPIPQFVDKDGKDVLEYTEGCKVKKDSQLDTYIKMAKAQVAQEELGSEVDIKQICTPERLQEQVSSLMYGASVVSKVEMGIDEDLYDFTKLGKLDEEKLKGFISAVNDPSNMTISPSVYQTTLDGAVNYSAAFASRLGTKVGKDKAVVSKVLDSIKDVDSRADGRTTPNATKRQARIEMLKRTLKSGVSAFAISAGISLAGTALSADAGITAATGGMNKVAGMALGTALGVGMTIAHICKWRKNRKAQGLPCGLKAMIKDRHLAPAIVTTALGSAALGFAVTGNPGVATALGYSSMAVGMASGAINSAIDAKQMGLSGLEAAVWGVAQAGTALGCGFAGRAAAHGFVNHYNEANPDNRIFQHEETTSRTIETTKEVYTQEALANAEKIVKSWYNQDPQLLQDRIASIEAYNTEHGTNINPYRLLMAAHDAGALSADNNLLHVQGGEDIHTHANHKVFGEGWRNAYGFSKAEIDSMAGIIQGNEVKLNPEVLKLFDTLDHNHIGAHNTVGHVNGATTQNDGVLGYNSQNVDGRMTVTDNGNTHFTTFADGDSAFKTITETKVVEDSVIVGNKFIGGLGMLGQVGNTFGKKLKERAGALLDGVKGVFKHKKPDVIEVIEDTPDVIEVIENVPEDNNKKKDPKENKTGKKEAKEIISKELLEEYKIVYGVDLYDSKTGKFKGENEEQIKRNHDRYKQYYAMVEAEMKADSKRKDLGMTTYLRLRKYDFDKVMCDSSKEDPKLIPTNQEHQAYLDGIKNQGNEVRVLAEITKKTRQSWMQSNLSEENRTKLTLSHFTKLLAEVKKASSLVADGSRNPDLNIDFKNNPKGIVVVSTDKLLFGQQGETVSEPIKFTGNESYLEKELAVRQKLDELNGVKHNPKTNAVKARVENGQKGKANTTPAPSRPR